MCNARVRLLLVLLVTVPMLAGRGAEAACDPTGADAADVANARAAVAAACDCATASSHGAYVHCAAAQIDAELVNHACAKEVRRCVSRSTCGRSGAVTCCRTTHTGATKCSIKRSSATCRAPGGGQACVSGLSSCCDACTSGGCTPSTSSSSSTSTTSIISTTTVSSSTCTTFTTVFQCTVGVSGSCGGGCASGTCVSDGGSCMCNGPPVPCPSTFGAQLCAGGLCPDGQTCRPHVVGPCNLQIGCGCQP